MSLKLDNVGYTYGRGTRFAQEALHDVSFEVSPGEMVLIVGATGSGKSTLLRLAAGLLVPGAGALAVDGAPYTRENTRGTVGLIFQDAESQLFADTVREDVEFGPNNVGLTSAQAAESASRALEAVGLDVAVYGARSPFTLSGGEARRAAIAGVLAMRPRYVLADEPTAGLDAPGRVALRRVLMDVRRDAGLVVVSHAAEEFLGDASRVLVLAGGTASWYGSAADVIAEPDVLIKAGLVAPDVLEVQRLAAAAGLDLGPFTMDPEAAARNLARAAGAV
jgi:energy-coupling factor transport system ATP-binding protein